MMKVQWTSEERMREVRDKRAEELGSMITAGESGEKGVLDIAGEDAET